MSQNEGAARNKSGKAVEKTFLTLCDSRLSMHREFPAIFSPKDVSFAVVNNSFSSTAHRKVQDCAVITKTN
jgi:hypothetical protein